MFKFASFETSKEFEEWQKENDVNVFQFAPIVTNMGLQNTEIEGSVEGQTSVGVFIVYGEKPKQDA